MALTPNEYVSSNVVRFVDDSAAAIKTFEYDGVEHTWTATQDCWITGICYCPTTAAANVSSYFTVGNKRIAFASKISPTSAFFAPIKKGQVLRYKNEGYNTYAYPMLAE